MKKTEDRWNMDYNDTVGSINLEPGTFMVERDPEITFSKQMRYLRSHFYYQGFAIVEEELVNGGREIEFELVLMNRIQ